MEVSQQDPGNYYDDHDLLTDDEDNTTGEDQGQGQGQGQKAQPDDVDENETCDDQDQGFMPKDEMTLMSTSMSHHDLDRNYVMIRTFMIKVMLFGIIVGILLWLIVEFFRSSSAQVSIGLSRIVKEMDKLVQLFPSIDHIQVLVDDMRERGQIGQEENPPWEKPVGK